MKIRKWMAGMITGEIGGIRDLQNSSRITKKQNWMENLKILLSG